MKKFFTLILLATIANFAVAQVTVTFNVDMSSYTATATFDVYIAGSDAAIGAWTEPGTDPAYMLTDEDEDGIYTFVATDVAEGEVAYKFFAGETGTINWDAGEWPGDPNRTVTVGTDNLNVLDGWSDVDSHEVTIATNLNDISATTKVYPNPSNGVFNIELNQKTNVKVMNILGSIVYEQELSGKSQIDLTNQASGIYFLNINETSKKLIIK